MRHRAGWSLCELVSILGRRPRGPSPKRKAGRLGTGESESARRSDEQTSSEAAGNAGRHRRSEVVGEILPQLADPTPAPWTPLTQYAVAWSAWLAATDDQRAELRWSRCVRQWGDELANSPAVPQSPNGLTRPTRS